MGGRWVTQRTWRPAAAVDSVWATTDATRPPMPASTSSKTSTGTRSARDSPDFSASIVRDSSPPEPLLLGDQLVVALQAVELAGGLGAEAEHRRLAVAVLAPEPGERVEPLVDGVDAPRLGDDAVAQPAHRRQRLVDLDAGGIDRLGRRGEHRIEPPEILHELERTGQLLAGRLGRV